VKTRVIDSETNYKIRNMEDVMTPALAIYPEIIETNVDATVRILKGDINRWRPHAKTSKLTKVLQLLMRRGVKHFKCATTLELLRACEAGAGDVLVSYPLTGANAHRVRQIADTFPEVKISALVEVSHQIESWRGSRVSLFVDINPGMNRTGIHQTRMTDILEIARAAHRAGIRFNGLHYYDGQLCDIDLRQRTVDAHRGYDRLLEIVSLLGKEGVSVEEVVTAGTPTLLCSAEYSPFSNNTFVQRSSPGTVVYSDLASAKLIPVTCGYSPAAVVVTRVVSHPSSRRITCDAGHKALSVDKGVPNGAVIGHPDYVLASPSEEHLPIDIPEGLPMPVIGDVLYLAPLHVCPTVNNFDYALFVRCGEIQSLEPVSARGHEMPLLMKFPAASVDNNEGQPSRNR
jgi:D-serine deaminase-like pyridoxal phosphate-dependent protein